MGFFRSQQLGNTDAKHSKRKHRVVPWIESPLKGANEEELVFHQRHEANTIELFFDLFFVANLATFTAYHSIIDSKSLLAYIGFFAIIWSTWFQITLHDVRFARDSIYERICKVIQMIVFIGFALVGSKFQPTTKKAVSNTNFRILCFTLALSRLLFAVQYCIVFLFCSVKGFKKLLLPLGLCILSLFGAAVVFFLMTPAFRDKSSTHSGIYAVWWIVMLLEAIIIITISCKWRMLSFKKTHLVERMGLLTLIVIGEGAIGVTKTVSRMMGKYGLDVEGCALIICILLILFFLWTLYFDNQPNQHYGTIRQQIWSVLHFPLHLAIVGVVEGSQQIALARYVLKNITKVTEKVADYCIMKQYDGAKLRDALISVIDYYQFDQKAETAEQYQHLLDDIYAIGNTSDVCSPSSLDSQRAKQGFTDVAWVIWDAAGALFQANGAKLDRGKDPTLQAEHSFFTLYKYYWASLGTVFLCTMIFLYLVRKKHKSDLFDWVAMIGRGVAVILCIGFLAVSGNVDAVSDLIASAAILPVVVAMLFIILSFDQLSRIWCNWRLKRQGLLPADEDEHGHGREHGHKPEHVEPKSSIGLTINESSYNPTPTYTPLSDFNTQPQFPTQPPITAAQFATPATSTGYAPPNHGNVQGGYMPMQNPRY